MIEIALIVGLVAIVYALLLIFEIFKIPPGEGKMVEISEFIKEGASAYLKRQYGIIISIALIIAVGVAVISYRLAISYVLGALSSTLAGFVGMYVAVNSNVRTTYVAKAFGLSRALSVAFKGGSVMGIMVVGVGTLMIALQYIAYGGSLEIINDIIGYSFGASTVALFARVGGGIYTKAADIGADLVGKVEQGIPEDDPRNPGVIADNVGDNVGDVAGMGADLFESYVGAIISTMVIAATTLAASNAISWALCPLIISSAGIIASILVTFVVRVKEGGDPSRPLTLASVIGSIIIALISYPITAYMLGSDVGVRVWTVIVIGLVAGVVIGLTSDYFTNKDKPPVSKVAMMSQMGPALTILSGFSYGFLSTAIPALGVAIAELLSFYILYSYGGFWYGIYGVALAAVGMLSLTGIVVSADAYGPITDNAAGIAEQAGLGDEVRAITDKLDSAGNTMKSISKGFAIGSAALTALAFLAAYSSKLGLSITDIKINLSLIDPTVLSGSFIGVALPALFVALVVMAVSDAAFVLIDEIRRQFKERPGIMEFKEKPDYGRVVAIVTSAAIKKLILPGAVAIISPLVVGFILGPYALGGMLFSSIITGLLLGLFQGNVGNTWDNAKKHIEEGKYGGKGSEAHKAAVIGDTVGDPLKDASGPSINILIKLMSVVSLVFIVYIVNYNLLGAILR
ncbi:MAG: sodium-translocating pyrophosphatase [Sulfolobales archaeon]|nr:sodium-translocating pyrophosphatase [Sulfolobales archaeon]MCX8185865.1 sodium-translocating pyrophosphatase [Sulfolobales archaeon]MDW7969122.1 sodium-translocating pyrophosphatase [Sulfolobales archaeon]